ncbi:S-layer homology domain-containing protein [Patescibacteria group bacterium]|nr:S-layer homology domain-containing protein [Patescibacteria group bacterium]
MSYKKPLFKTIFTVLVVTIIGSIFVAQTTFAAEYEYIPGAGIVPTGETSSVPTGVNNDGLFGMEAKDFRLMCYDTGGEWDIVAGRHICYCPAHEDFTYPYGCPVVVVAGGDDYYYGGDNYYYGDDDYYYYGNDDDNYYDSDQYYSKNDGDYWDIDDHWAREYIIELSRLGIIRGYSDGSFRPENPVTRAEMTKMVLMAARIRLLQGDTSRTRFFADLDTWQAVWVNAAYRMDIVEGYTGPAAGIRLFKPNNYVNRVEGIKLVLAAFGRRPLDFEKASFRDVEEWMIPWVEDAYRIGLIKDTNDMRFRPADNMTRGMAAAVIVRMMDYVD